MARQQPINWKPSDKYVHQILEEGYRGQMKQSKYVLKMPCGHGNIELTEPKTTYIVCNTCHKKMILKWEMRNKTIKEIS